MYNIIYRYISYYICGPWGGTEQCGNNWNCNWKICHCWNWKGAM